MIEPGSQFIFFATTVTLTILASCGLVAFFVYRRILRRAKDIERSLKMVPVLIKLPPAQNDQNSSRDQREEIKENIAKAEGVFNLLSGVATKNKAWLYGQRHISLEIIAQGETISFHAAIPVVLLSAVEKALVSGYPGIQISKVEDPNIFSETSKISGVAGGELKLKKDNYFPIKHYKLADFDALSGMLSTLSKLSPGEGAAVQILLRPAGSAWAKRARQRAKDILNPEKAKKKDPTNIALQIAKAPFVAPSEQKEKSKDSLKQPDQIDQKRSQMIEEKAASPAFECLVRLVASAGDGVRAKMILQDMLTGFAQFDLPGSNGFSFRAAKTPQKLATDFIFRFFPASKKNLILSSVELATIFHLPSEQMEISTPLERTALNEVAAPASLPEEGLVLGSNKFRGSEKVVRLTDKDRTRHFYIIGQTGTGKSVMLENMAVQDMAAGKGFCLIDPHGELAEKVLAKVPASRANDVIYFNPADTAMPLGLNILEFDPAHPEQKDFIIQETINMLYKLYDPQHQGIVGPRFEHWYRNAALTIMSDPEGATFLEVPKPFTDDDFLKAKFKHVTNPIVQDFWIKEMGQTSDFHKSEMLGWFVSKWGQFQGNEIMRNIIGQRQSSFDIKKVMDEGKILIVNLSKGLVGDQNSNLLGMIFVIKILTAALARSSTPPEQRRQFTLYVDEFQNFATDSFATILSEARKYNLCLVVANQFIAQLNEQIKGAVFGNVGSIMGYRVGPEDAEFLVKQFEPNFDTNDLVNLPNGTAALKLLVDGLPTPPFTYTGIWPPVGRASDKVFSAVVELSRNTYGRPKAEVDTEVAEALRSTPKAAAVPVATERRTA